MYYQKRNAKLIFMSFTLFNDVYKVFVHYTGIFKHYTNVLRQ